MRVTIVERVSCHLRFTMQDEQPTCQRLYIAEGRIVEKFFGRNNHKGVILGWRMLISGLSNVRRWPNPVNTASILFPKGATFFGLVATFFMVVGGFGVAAG